MKIRTDYVTNSSSSSFILARKDELSQRQKDAIVDYVVQKMLGSKLTQEELDEYVEDYGISDSEHEKMQEELNKGLSLFRGYVSFEEGNEIAFLLKGLWEAIEQADPSSFVGLDTSLSY